MKFFGREDIIQQLMDLWGKNVSSLVTCRGRRRIGKSTLIEKFAEDSHARFIKIEGLKPTNVTTDEDERRTFAEQLALQSEAESSCPENWLDAFKRLSKEIRDDERTVVLLDEVSWMAQFDGNFASVLKIAWDNFLKRHDRLVFVVCGSVSMWIRGNLIDNKAFFGRRSLDVVVPELPVRECVKFWGEKASQVPEGEIVDFLSVTGGVPKYLEELNPSLSTAENLRRMAFRPHSVLRTDFDEMFTDVITRQTRLSGAVLRSLVHGSKTVSEIASAIGVSRGGDLSGALSQLMESGLVSGQAGKNPKTGEDLRIVRYRIRDNYARFYLRYLEPVKDMIDADSYQFSGLEQFSGWETDLGFQFENLVLNNFRQILKPLHLENVLVKSAAPYAKKGSRKTGEKGVQIDLLVQTNMALCLVEIKRRKRIGTEIEEEVRSRLSKLGVRRGISKRTALVYEGELAPEVIDGGYFDFIVPAAELLNA